MTRSNVLYALRPWLAWCRRAGLVPEAASRRAIQVWINEQLAGGRHPRTVNADAGWVRGWYRWMHRVGMIRIDPMEGVIVPRRPKTAPDQWLGPRDLGLLLARARVDALPGVSAAVHLWGVNGPRLGETLALDVGDVRRIDDATVIRLERGKDTGVDWLGCPPIVAEQVHRARAGRRSGPLLLNRAGRRLDAGFARAELRRLCEAVGVPVVTPKGLRVGAISLALGEHVPPRDVQIAAGHRGAATTEYYDRARIAATAAASQAVAALVARDGS
ncbi:MAG: tyrosine-type recombinase/integrase [Propionicimonas sp.]